MKKNDQQQVSAVDNADQAPYFFHQGTTTRAYEYLGAHRCGERFVFRVWAPNAEYVSVVADFNGWDRGAHPMKRITERGVWELTLPSECVMAGQCYKYCIRNAGREFLKSDPYAFAMEKPPETASVIADIDSYDWRDAGWMRYRKGKFTRENITKVPLNIYEVHAGSWKRHGDGSYYTYRELATELSSYVKQMGYTHIELMPLSEYPFDGSWGYQVSGYYAATARFGSPTDLMYLVDTMHEAGIGVILDWVPAHFPKDAHGLYEFDGQPLYEYQGLDRREHPTWGTRCFDVGREEVQSFLISNACFWAEKYHIDGLRVDAVAAMLYLDFDRLPHQWIPNRFGDNKNLEAVAFFQKFNGAMAREYPDVMTIAEESTAWANLTHFENGGLGFTLKWNMGWMNDSLAYLEQDPLYRRHHHHKLTFSLTYAYGENYVLPISHDEVVHGKKSLLDRATGDYWQKFATTRTYLAYLMTHPGKKLLFMGCEYGPFREWDFADSLEWFMLDYEKHAKMQLYTAELNHLYLKYPALWEQDGSIYGFEWIDADNVEQSIYSYRRRDAKGRELIVVLNFTPVRYDDFLLAVPQRGYYEEIFNSDSERFGGSGCTNEGRFRTEPALLRSYGQAIRVKVPPLGAAIFRMTRAFPKSKKK
ncbi:MAG: 1,4-alpha-glucan branching protein GlgB [Clostridia bacterium]|nr:1,4-alpha-glucan branching protein GlgB [Clostridia bacterium]